MAGLPMMPWYPRDFMASTRGWSLTARGAYMEALNAQWELGALPVDPEKIRELLGGTDSEWRKIWPKIEEKFPIFENVRKNKRLEEHRVRAMQLYESRANGARIATERRTANVRSAYSERTHPNPDPNHIQNHNQILNPKSAERAPADGQKAGAPAQKGPDPELVRQLVEQERQQRERLFPGLREGQAPEEHSPDAPRELRRTPAPLQPLTDEEIAEKKRRVDAELARRIASA